MDGDFASGRRHRIGDLFCVAPISDIIEHETYNAFYGANRQALSAARVKT